MVMLTDGMLTDGMLTDRLWKVPYDSTTLSKVYIRAVVWPPVVFRELSPSCDSHPFVSPS